MPTDVPSKEDLLAKKTESFIDAAHSHGYPELADFASQDNVNPRELQQRVNDEISEHDDFDALRTLLETATRMEWLWDDLNNE